MIIKILKKIKQVFIACQENSYKPYILRSNFLFVIVLGLFILKIAILPFYGQFSKSAFFAKIVSSELISLLNKERTELGLNSLKENPELKKAALLKAQDMLENDYFDHTSPIGITGWYFVDQAGYDYKMAGENLAIGFLNSDEVHKAWNESPSHKDNLLNFNFQEIGIAVLKGDFDGNETTVVVQLFGKPKQEVVLATAQELSKENVEPIIAQETESLENKITEQEIPVAGEVEAGSEKVIEPKTPFIVLNSDSLQQGFWTFFATKYNGILEKISFFIAFLISIALMLNLIIILRAGLPAKLKLASITRLSLPSFLSMIALIFLGVFGQIIVFYLIPHNLII
ncbi:MAG: hypothetical protein ISS87_02635 [Candidatus Pacebacteria bacterium]|nr:hypothetical protein [Candidatus Paceibacterota bacterium]